MDLKKKKDDEKHTENVKLFLKKVRRNTEKVKLWQMYVKLTENVKLSLKYEKVSVSEYFF